VTTHTLFCLKTALDHQQQHYLCGMLNSFVANYLVRLVMTTHLGSTTVEELRMPKPDSRSELFAEIADAAEMLAEARSAELMARLQALAARAYELSADEFAHVLTTFPLVGDDERAAAYEKFNRL
jgi:hypothetical protein